MTSMGCRGKGNENLHVSSSCVETAALQPAFLWRCKKYAQSSSKRKRDQSIIHDHIHNPNHDLFAAPYRVINLELCLTELGGTLRALDCIEEVLLTQHFA